MLGSCVCACVLEYYCIRVCLVLNGVCVLEYCVWLYVFVRVRAMCMYSATREDDTTFIFSHFGLFLSDAASNSHK